MMLVSIFYSITLFLVHTKLANGQSDGPERSREPTAKEIAACKVAKEEFYQMAPTWPEQFDYVQKVV